MQQSGLQKKVPTKTDAAPGSSLKAPANDQNAKNANGPKSPADPPKKVEEKPIKRSQEIKHVPGSQIIIDHKATLGEPNTKVFCAKFDYEDKYVAAATESGEIQIYNVENTERLSKGKPSYVLYSTTPNIPFSYVRWRPVNSYNKTRNVLATVNADGEIQHWHILSGKCMDTIKLGGMDPQLYCLDFNNDATKFAVSGSDPVIKYYDEVKRDLEMNLTGGEGGITPGHSSRVYCVKFDRENPNILLSGGWDYRVIVWDMRTGKPARGIYGPLICGDGIDIFEDVILTSSWTQSSQLQMWDLDSGKQINTIDWDATMRFSTDPIFLYAGQFSKVDGSLILAGGSNSNEAKLFDRNNYEKAFCTITDLSREIDTVDFGNKGNMFTISGGDGLIRLFSMNITA